MWTQSGCSSKLLDDLAKSLSDEDESTSPNIDPKLAETTMKRWGKKLNPEKLKIIIDKYQRPANCKSMAGIRCNPEIWSQLSSNKKRTDLHLFNIQQVVLKVAVASLQTTNALATSKSGDDQSHLLAQSVDIIALLAHAHTQTSQLRRDQIKPILKQEYSTICSAEIQPDSKWLFGSDLAKTLKDAKEASSISSSFRNNSQTGFIQPINSRQGQTTAISPTNVLTGFFMEKPAKTLPKKEKVLEQQQDKPLKIITDLKQLRTSVSEFANFVPNIVHYFELACTEFRAG